MEILIAVHFMLEPQSVEQHDLLYKAVYPAEAETQPGTTSVVCMCNNPSESYSL